MGLEAFLIPLESPSPQLHGLEDLLVSPPDLAEPRATPEAPEAVEGPPAPPHPPAVPDSVPIPAVSPSSSIDAPTLASAGLPLASPPEFVQAPPAMPTVVDSPEAPAVPGSPRPIEAPALDAARLDGFLAASVLEGPAAASAPPGLADDESVVAPLSFMSPFPPTTVAAFAPPARGTEPPSFAASGPSTAGGSPGVDWGAGLDAIEGRIAQVADRLEQAVDRLAAASPPAAGGARPRAFRGRIDG